MLKKSTNRSDAQIQKNGKSRESGTSQKIVISREKSKSKVIKSKSKVIPIPAKKKRPVDPGAYVKQGW